MWLTDQYTVEEIILNNKYPDVNDPGLQLKIANILEFTISSSESEILFPYQDFVRKYMSPYTPYEYLILYHSLGSGKTIAAISIAVDNYLVLGKKSCIITKGSSSENNFKEQIEIYANISKKKFPRNIFQYIHYIELSNKIRNNSDEFTKELFSNKVFIMDEIHNIKDIKENGTLQNICKGIQLSKDSKFIYLTATPMVDNSKEIESLLLLTNRKLPKKYDDEILKQQLNGIVSYSSRSMKKAKEKNMGNRTILGEKYYVSYIKDKQLEMYLKMYPNSKNVYQDIIQLSLFCSREGVYGDSLISRRFLIKDEVQHAEKKYSYNKYNISKVNMADVTSSKLDMFSSVYNNLLKILRNTKTGKIFIFLEHVHGSGIIMLSAILEANGYKITGGEHRNLRGKFFTICVGDTTLCPNLEERLKLFNSPDNKQGERIQILIGSKIVGESVNLTNVKQFHFISHHWNNSYLEQSKGRVIREKSHDNIEDEVEIYVHLILLEGEHENRSIDLYKLETCHTKQSEVDHVKNIMINSAVDKYVFDNSAKSTNHISFAILHSRNYIQYVIEDIFDCVINKKDEYLTLDDLVLNIENTINKYPEVLLEMTRIIILYNIPCEAYNGLFLRCSYKGLYLTDNMHWPFWDFAPYTNKNITDNISEDYKSLPDIKSRILFLEKQELLDIYELLFVIDNNTKYHIMEYSNSDNAYKASVTVPSTPSGLTKKFVNSRWEYVKNKQEELKVFRLFEIKRKQMFFENAHHNFHGYISIIDNEIRYKNPTSIEREDKRKITRGISLKSMTKDKLLILCMNCGIYNYQLAELSKTNIVDKIKKYMYETNSYHYI